MKALGSALLLLGLTTATTLPVQAQGRVVKRDLNEWLNVQGTFANPRPIAPNTPRLFGLVNNPDINGDGVDDGPRYFVWWDYAGVLSRSFYKKPNGVIVPVPGNGTLGPASITGSATERPLGDGRSVVTVDLDVQDALIWVAAFGGAVQGPTVLGHREADVAAGAAQAYVSGHYTVKFYHPTGAPFIDLIETNAHGDWFGDILVLNAAGPLTEAFDPNVPEGTPGRLHWGKPYITPPANENASNGAYSQFPNDEFHLFPIGPR